MANPQQCGRGGVSRLDIPSSSFFISDIVLSNAGWIKLETKAREHVIKLAEDFGGGGTKWKGGD